jgi:hypothetical protein
MEAQESKMIREYIKGLDKIVLKDIENPYFFKVYSYIQSNPNEFKQINEGTYKYCNS